MYNQNVGLVMFVIDYFALRNEREEAEQFVEYTYLNLDIDRAMYKFLHDYLEISFQNKGDK